MSAMAGRRPYVLLVLAVVVLDQVTKVLVDRFLELHESRPVMDGLIHLTYVRNRGAAFGILSEAGLPYQSGLFALVSLAALLAIGLYAWRIPASSRLPQGALALIMGGALGNLVDRTRLGYVIDFVDVFWGPHHWPAFNVADSCISVGVALLILDIVRAPGADRAEGAGMAEASAAGRTD